MIENPICGQLVRLNVPENARLHRAAGTVETVWEWGAVVKTEAAAAGRFRAAQEEMDPVDSGFNGKMAAAEMKSAAMRRGDAAVNRAPETMDATGNLCGYCGSARMIRTGTCETCLDCATSAGGCG